MVFRREGGKRRDGAGSKGGAVWGGREGGRWPTYKDRGLEGREREDEELGA